MTARTCLFCTTGRPLTKEHVYPRWLYRAMNVRGQMTIRSDGGAERTAMGFDIQVRAVCAGCNNGWMHDLEVAVRRIILPTFHRMPIRLDADRQRVVALWAAKTWLLAEYAHAKDRLGAFSSPDLLPYLWRERKPPPFVTVRLGAVDSEQTQILSLSSTYVWGLDKVEPVGALAVLTIGDLVFHIWHPVWEEGETIQQLMVGPLLSRYLTQIWPNEVSEVGWPPPSIMPLSGLARFTPSGRIGDSPSDG